MPLNYSKWDQLELSDDSDIEGHPNVDHKSLVRWKQRDIHEKRESRKVHIQALNAEIACNAVLVPRLEDIFKEIGTSTTPLKYLSNLVEQLQTNPSKEAPPTNAPDQPTYDAMVLSLLLQVSEEAKKAVGAKSSGGDNAMVKKLKEGLERHMQQLGEHNDKLRTELEHEEKEQKKHITSEDMHEGFDSKYVPAKPEPAPIKNSKIDTKGKGKAKVTEFETINTPVSSSSSLAALPTDSDSDIDPEDELPELTHSLELFSKLPLKGYEQSWKFIQSHRDVVVAGASDALLVAAFRAESAGNGNYAKRCVHQSLLLSYCEKLGSDGVRVFFQRMVSGDTRAESLFANDVEGTYSHLVTRVLASQEESGPVGGVEQIQLVPENPSQTISFNVPDGPPPEEITLEGPGTEGLDVEEVKKALQLRWDVFDAFSERLKDALKSGKLDAVNKVLGDMGVDEAEEVVRLLDVGGILSFAEGGIRDQTGKDEDEEEVE